MPGVVKAAAPLHTTATEVDAGIPVHVRAVAAVLIATDGIVQTHAFVIAVPAVPSFVVPATSSFAAGVFVPIPTFPPASTIIRFPFKPT